MKSDDLFGAAYKSERVLGRRLAKKSGLSEHDALTKILQAAAAPLSLADLIAQRAAIRLGAQTRVETRRRDKADDAAGKLAQAQPDPRAWQAWFDGATRPNPGEMGIGGLLKNPEGQIIEISRAAGHGDSNEAEYLALIAVLEEAVRNAPPLLVVYGDSRVVIDDVLGLAAKPGARCLTHYRTRAKQLLSQLNAVALKWIPRRKNASADALSQQAISDVCP